MKIVKTEAEELTTGYEIADSNIGEFVRIYMNTGVVLTGRLIDRKGKYLLVHDKFRERPTAINMDMVSSIA
jgi:hypothetical protein